MFTRIQAIFTSTLIIVLALLYMQLTSWHSSMLGVLLGVTFVCCLAILWRDILHHVFRFETGFVSVILSGFAAVFLVSSVEAMFIALYTTTPALTWVSLSMSAVITTLLRAFALSRSHGSKIVGKGRRQYMEVFPKLKWLSWVYAVLWVGTLLLFITSDGVGPLVSPWQSLHAWILPLMFVLTAILGFILFSKQKTKHILLLILMHSALLHAYLPFSHQLPWGGDVWRHIASESRLAAGDIIPPVLFGPEAKWREVAGIDVPEVFLIPQKYTYGQFWSLAVVTHQVTGISLEAINIWMIPIMWSIVFPLMLFRIGRILFRSWRGGLLLAWVSFIAFPLQALGALTLPVSLGVLTFFFFLMLWLQYLGKHHWLQRWFLFGFGFLMLFGYTLTFLLMCFVVLGSWLLGKISKHVRSEPIGWSLVALLTLLGIIAFPALELLAGLSSFPAGVDLFAEAKQVVGQFFGYFYASGIGQANIASGNFFFNHTPAYAFVSNIFTAWRWGIVLFMLLVWASVFAGLALYIKERQPLRFLLPAWLVVSLAGGYKISWFILEGDRLFVRRFDPYLSTLFLIFACVGLLAFFHHVRFKRIALRRSIALVSILLIAWFGTSTYASGPDMRTTSIDEHAAATYVLEHSSGRVCVVADTWVLLPLEGLSAGQIVGGNFPIDYQFGQEARVALYNEFLSGVLEESLLADMFAQSGADDCSIVLGQDQISEERVREISELVQEGPIWHSGFVIWQVDNAS